jgi:acetyl-CoA carboxylase biotin carboxyl carrier protein
MLRTFIDPKPAPSVLGSGAMVDKDDPVCIIEVMKLFNTVKAGVQGDCPNLRRTKQLVEYQQILFLIENNR